MRTPSYVLSKLVPQLALVSLLASTSVSAADVAEEGDIAPDFALQGIDGEQIALTDLKGQVVLVFFIGYN